MTFSNRTLLRTVTVAGLTASLTGCFASSPEAGRPNLDPGTATVSSPRPAAGSPTQVSNDPPERPEQANGLTLAAAEQFIRHYVDLMNYAAKTGDTTAMRTVSQKDCVGCGEYYGSVEKVNEQNGGLRGDYLERIVEVTELTKSTNSKLTASTNVTVGNYTARQSSSSKPVSVKASAYTEEMVLAPANGNWQMFEMELTER